MPDVVACEKCGRNVPEKGKPGCCVYCGGRLVPYSVGVDPAEPGADRTVKVSLDTILNSPFPIPPRQLNGSLSHPAESGADRTVGSGTAGTAARFSLVVELGRGTERRRYCFPSGDTLSGDLPAVRSGLFCKAGALLVHLGAGLADVSLAEMDEYAIGGGPRIGSSDVIEELKLAVRSTPRTVLEEMRTRMMEGLNDPRVTRDSLGFWENPVGDPSPLIARDLRLACVALEEAVNDRTTSRPAESVPTIRSLLGLPELTEDDPVFVPVGEVEDCPPPVIPPGTPMNVHIPLIGDGPGRIVVEYRKPDPDYDRRLRYVPVPERFVFDAYFFPGRLRSQVAVLKCPQLPDGFELIPGAHHDPMHRCFNFLIRHPSFDPVPDGDMIPSFPGRFDWQWEFVEVKKSDPGT